MCQAQTPIFHPIKPNNSDLKFDIYNVFQDTRGFIWMGSNNGVYQYDGELIEHFSEAGGLPDLDIMNIFEDANGLIWFSTYRSGLFYFDYNQNIISSPRQNNQLVKLLKNTWVSELHIDKNKDIWCYNFSYDNYGVNRDYKKLKTNLYHISQDSIKVYNFRDSTVAVPLIEQTKDKKTQEFLQYIYTSYRGIRIPRKAFRLADSTLVGFNNNTVFLKRKEAKVFDYLTLRPNRIFTVLPNQYQQILVLIEKNTSDRAQFYLQTFDKENPSGPIQEIRLPNTFNQCYQDKEGRYWFWSPSKGVQLCPNLHIYQLNTAIAQDWNGIEQYEGKLWGWNSSGVYQNITNNASLVGKYRSSSSSPKQLYINKQVYFDRMNIQKGKALVSSPLFSENHIKCFHSLTDSLLLVGTSSGFLALNTTTQRLLFNSREHNFKHGVYSLYTTPNKVWIGSNKGLYSWDKREEIHLEKAAIQIHAIEQFSKSKLLFAGTHSKGLFVKNGATDYYINSSHGLGSNKINSLYGEQDSILWVGTSNGLQKVVFHNNSNYSIYPIIDKFKITDITNIGDTIYVLGNNNILYFDKNKIISRVNNPPPFYIKAIEINNQSVTLDSVYQLQQTENNLNIHLQHLNFEKIPDQLMYRLVHNQDLSSNWQVASSKILQYRSLAAGEWTFYYTTNLQLQTEHPNIKKVVFHIAQPLTQTLWFWLLLGGLSLLSITSISFFLYKRQQKQLGIKKRLVELELNLLRAQMNPHFIYNAMNSILGYIMRKDPLTTANYFSRFSMLMRNIMENTKHPFIELTKEIEALEIYLELEQLRLGKKHHCQLNISHELKYSSFKIPPMLIQPFIENAIIHGITPLKEGGIIDINISILNDSNLQVSITDNGIGRTASKKLKMQRQARNRKNSMGIHNSRDRINIINETYKTNIKLTIEDLEKDGKSLGTRVILFFPNLI
ncbi:MAG: hypothetical protein GY810_01395 [Aureispira sp.]|nr:hypothetical protein [Aureispira sp.]